MKYMKNIVASLLAIGLFLTFCTGCVPLVAVGGGALLNQNKGAIGDAFHTVKNGKSEYLLKQKQELDASAAMILSKFAPNRRPIFYTNLLNDGQRYTSLEIVIAQNSFLPGSPNLSREAQQLVELVASSLSARSQSYIKLETHTDKSGSVQTNQLLSDQRILTLKSLVLAKGVKGDRIKSAQGYGFQRPWILAKSSMDHKRAVIVAY